MVRLARRSSLGVVLGRAWAATALMARWLYDGEMSTHRVLISQEQIAARIAELGEQITRDLTPRVGDGGNEDGVVGLGSGSAIGGKATNRLDPSQRLVLIPVLTGALVFVADLIRHIPLQMNIRPVTISSYPGAATASQGANIHGGVPTDLGGSHVLIVDDILDSGRTLGLLRRIVTAQNPASVRIAVLLDKHKPSGRAEDVEVEYVGFGVQDEFVVGYGLDYDGLYRNLPYVAVMGEV